MSTKWTDKQVDDLLKQARKTFGTNIPLSVRIQKMNDFLHQMLYYAGDKDWFRFKITRLVFHWKHINWERTGEIDVPYDVAWAAFHSAREHLDRMCDELKDLLGNKYKEEQK